MPKTLHSNESSTLDITKPLEKNEVLLGRVARLIHRELLIELQKNKLNNIKPGSTAVIAVGNRLLFATENHIGNEIIQGMKRSLAIRLSSYATKDKEDLKSFIEERKDKLREHIDSFSHQKVEKEFYSRWQYKKHYDGSTCTIDDVYKYFERTIIGIQDDIDIAVLACCLIEKEEWVHDLLEQKNIVYIKNISTHGEKVKGHNSHPEITLVSHINKFYPQFGDQLPILKKDDEEVPYLFVASGIKSCKKCHTLLSGCSEPKFDGFNGAYHTSKSPNFVVFLYDHYDSSYPRYWIPTSFQHLLNKSSAKLHEILDETSIPSRARESEDRIAFFLDRIIQEDYLTTELQCEQTLSSPELLLEVEHLDVPYSSPPELKDQPSKPSIKDQHEAPIQFWAKLKSITPSSNTTIDSTQGNNNGVKGRLEEPLNTPATKSSLDSLPTTRQTKTQPIKSQQQTSIQFWAQLKHSYPASNLNSSETSPKNKV